MAKHYYQLTKSDELPIFSRCLFKVFLGSQMFARCFLSPYAFQASCNVVHAQ